jgi:hypothetical protein
VPTAKAAMVDQVSENGKSIRVPNESGREGNQLHHLGNGTPTDYICSFLHHLLTENVSMVAWVLMSCAEMWNANLGTKARRFL